MNLQDAFLNQVRIQQIPVSIFLNSGHQMKGTVTGFDSFIVLLASADKQNMIYKHSIATIMPMRHIEFRQPPSEEAEEPNTGDTNNDPAQ